MKSRTENKLEDLITNALHFAKESNLNFPEMWSLESVKRLRQLATAPVAAVTDDGKERAKEGPEREDGSKETGEKASSSSSMRNRRKPLGSDHDDAQGTAHKTPTDGFPRNEDRVQFLQDNFKLFKSQLDRLLSARLKNKGVATLLVSSIVVAVAFAFQQKGFTILCSLGVGLGFLEAPTQSCAATLSDDWRDRLRPPVDCAFCEGVTSVARVSRLDPERFFSEYVETRRPVVVTDAMTNWTATEHFSYEFFRQLYNEGVDGNDGPHSLYFIDKFEDAQCQFFPYQTEFMNLREVFSMDEDRAGMKPGYKPWYVGWGSCDADVNEILREYYQRPYFLPQTSEGTKMDWIFMGTSGFGAHMHVDHVKLPSWQAQIKGKKLWSLQPPPECYFRCADMDVTVEPGETIVLDTNRWFHSTRVISEEISITIGSEFD